MLLLRSLNVSNTIFVLCDTHLFIIHTNTYTIYMVSARPSAPNTHRLVDSFYTIDLNSIVDKGSVGSSRLPSSRNDIVGY